MTQTIVRGMGIALLVVVLSGSFTATANQTGPFTFGEMRRWHPIYFGFVGETACEAWDGAWNSADFNPFLHRRMVVTFTNGPITYNVPAFFNGSGVTAFSDEVPPAFECGNQWVVRFTPDQVGTWTYSISYRQGENLAVSLDPFAGVPGVLDGVTGSFFVEETNKVGPDFRSKGNLRYVNEHYPRFDNGEYFLTTGTDSPENFMGYTEFHNTFDHEVREEFGPFVHTYETHFGDYFTQPGILWGANLDRGFSIYGALNYLSSVGVNSVYMVNNGIDGGDAGDVWPWSCPNALVPDCVEDKQNFDISKLDQWELVFRHMHERGIQIHFVLTETENDNDFDALQKNLYIREMIARFGHHHAIIWNVGEEFSLEDERIKEIAAYIRAVDPMDHRITVHNMSDEAFTYFDNLVDDPNLNAASIQESTPGYNQITRELRQQSAAEGRPWIVYGTEQPDRISEDLSDWARLRRDGLWGNLMGGGGGVQWYVAYQSDEFGDVNLGNFRLLEEVYKDSTIAREFFETRLPGYWFMEPRNDLVRTNDGTIFALANPGILYAVYVEEGTADNELDLRNVVGIFNVGWYSPRSGRYATAPQQVFGGDWVSLGPPPYVETPEFEGDTEDDYAIVVFPAFSAAQLDVVADGIITPEDAIFVTNRINTQDLRADVNGDGFVNGLDAQAVTLSIGQVVPIAP